MIKHGVTLLKQENLKLEIDLPNGFAQQKSPLLVESCAIVMIKPGVTQLEQEDFYIDKHPPLCHPCESRDLLNRVLSARRFPHSRE